MIGEVIEYIIANKFQLIEAYLAIIGGASIIVKLTPTKKDDIILAKVKDFIAKFIALNIDIQKKK